MALHRALRKPDEVRRVYQDNVRAVFTFFAYSVRREQAEDLTSATFERVLRSWHRFDPAVAGERTWILSIARNLLIDHYRRTRATTSLDEHPAILDALEGPADAEGRLTSRDGFVQHLAGLPARDRQALALRYAGDLEVREIARILEVSEANAHQILSRAHRRLRDRLDDTAAPAAEQLR